MASWSVLSRTTSGAWSAAKAARIFGMYSEIGVFWTSTVVRGLGLAGDVVVAQTTIESIRQVRSLTTMATTTDIRTVDGEHVCTAHSTLVERGA